MKTEKAWHYLNIAKSVARLSKDTSTQVGAVIIGPNGEGGPWGYNGAPRGSDADNPTDYRSERPEKYFWMEHAERNAIYTAARTGFRTVGCTLVTTHAPCMDCARAIVQAGIVHVVWQEGSHEFNERWLEHSRRVTRLFNETGVSYEII
jgi:dCMP deaminase